MVAGAALIRSYPAVAATVPLARAEVTEVALGAGIRGQALDSIRLAASEAVTNAVRHAYPDGPGEVHVTAAVTGSELWVLIADDGCGLGTRRTPPGLGLGLALVACVADQFTVAERARGGTELRMGFEIGARDRPADRQSPGSALSAGSAA